MKYELPEYLMMGVTEERYWDSTPKELEPYVEAYKRKVEEEDFKQWRMGIYMMSAINNAVNGGKYLEEPLSLLAKRENDEHMSEKEIEAERQKFLGSLLIMQANSEMKS